MLTLIGASASGKTEIAKILIRDHGFQKLVTYTTREPRQGEKDGVDYHFLSMRAFLEKRARAEFVETTEYNGNLYGTSFNDVRHDRVVIVEPKGANALYEKLADRMVIAAAMISTTSKNVSRPTRNVLTSTSCAMWMSSSTIREEVWNTLPTGFKSSIGKKWEDAAVKIRKFLIYFRFLTGRQLTGLYYNSIMV